MGVSLHEKRQPEKFSIEKKFVNRLPLFVQRERNFYATARQSNWGQVWPEIEAAFC